MMKPSAKYSTGSGILEITWMEIDSDMIEEIAYHRSEKFEQLVVGFKTGDYYQYSDIDVQTITKLLTSESVGKAFHQYVKDKFPYKRV